MKILFPCERNPFYDSSAIGNRYESLLNGLLSFNIEINILVLGGYNSFGEFRKKGFKNYHPQLKFNYLNHSFQNSLWLRRFNSYILAPITYNYVKKKLLSEFNDSYDFIWLTGNLQLRKIILENINHRSNKTQLFIELSEYQNIHKDESGNSNSFQTKNLDEYTQITLELIKHLDAFAIMTKALINYYINLADNPKAKFIHLPMTVDLVRFNNVDLTDRWKKPYIAFTGTYTNQKDGVDILIQAFNKIHFEFPRHNLLLAGFYHPDIIKQKDLIRQFGLEDKVKYLGIIDKNDIPEFLSNAELLVLPRPDSKQAQGGFPTKLGEYLATGNPVCATTVGEIPDYLVDGESVYFAKPGCVESFAIALRRALCNPEEAKRIGANGRKVAETHFNKDIQAKKLYDFFLFLNQTVASYTQKQSV